ncbi:MAG TPA: glutamate--cysteine ligase, partial [Acidocella sp.]|nr:glutamate--cysteine ligase [Acidocella sp.]
MSNPGDTDATIVNDVRDLAAYLASGCKPGTTHTIGTEHEAFGFKLNNFAPPSYEEHGGIRDLLAGIEAAEGLDPIIDNGNTIGLKG